ncbi:MAG: DNA repair protein [Nitratireductor sp.]|nr:DNA repair protein [Nitratireductor sp.]
MQVSHPEIRDRECAAVFTIGHSNRSLECFVEMLRSAAVELVVDVRTFPRSRTNPQFNIDTLAEDLAPFQIGYEHWPALGGRRRKQPDVPDDQNGLWRNRSFHNYADYALSDTFQSAIADLMALAGRRRPALMCSEAVWWRCHRRIITDYLLAHSVPVLHIMDVNKISEAKLTAGAAVQTRSVVTVTYPETQSA